MENEGTATESKFLPSSMYYGAFETYLIIQLLAELLLQFYALFMLFVRLGRLREGNLICFLNLFVKLNREESKENFFALFGPGGELPESQADITELVAV